MLIQGIRGFKDILPGEIEKWQYAEREARRIFGLFGFLELRIPILERTEIFSRSIGEATDIVGKEMYTFADRDGDSLTLRPEATTSIMRAYLEHGLNVSEPVGKYYFIGPMFRYERPQKGRYRQFHQIDAEILGVREPQADAEILVMLTRFLNSLGLKNIGLQINSLGDPACRATYKREVQDFLRSRKDRLCEDCQRRLETNPLRVFDCKKEECQAQLAGAPSILDFLCADCRAHFDQVKKLLDEVKIPYTINPRMVRGLDYYTRTAFEVVAGELGAQNAVCGGGRYDGLAEEIGGPSVPGIGFAIGVERLVMLLPEEKIPSARPDVFVAALGENAKFRGFTLAQELRDKGIWAEEDYEAKSLKSQMRKADRMRAPLVIILGEEELKKKAVVMRDMASKAQEEVPFEKIAEKIKEKTKTAG
ncbi:MAG TPA: histidine--tRNA ligase [Thermodesulfobacteriota bacterium]|nr:histidine--tRNA ligase [Thermodesulfobacteriota bacterium]